MSIDHLNAPTEKLDFQGPALGDDESGISRRDFVHILGAGLLIATTAQEASAQVAAVAPRAGRGGGRGGGAPVALDARLHIGNDGIITVMTGKVEGGQGSRAQLTQAAVEELGVSVEQVQLIMADTGLVPNDGGTTGSSTSPNTVPLIRQACAVAKGLLIAFAAKQWNIATTSVVFGNGAASNASGQRLTYADLASSDQSTEAFKQTVPRDVQVTQTSEWKVLGTPLLRPNAKDIVQGIHKYPSDQIRPGMLYGKILRPPGYGAKLISVDLAPAKAMEGVFAVQTDQFVGVAAPTTYLAKKALQAIEETAKWEAAAHPSSKDLAQHLRSHARGGISETPFSAEVAAAAKSLKATYEIPYVQHAPLEPRAAVAEWQDGKVTVWTGSQNPFAVRTEIATAMGVSADQVRVIIPDFGGGFGGKHTGETAVEAARLAKAAGKPVAIRWTRPEEFTWAYFRPAAVIDLHASLDAAGAITSWYSVDINYGQPGIETPYHIAAGKNRSQVVQTEPPLRHGSYRALATTANMFARESFMDELAAAAGKDPLEFRLANLDNARLRAVLEDAAKRFDWAGRRSRRDQNIGVGLACGTDKGSFVAACVEVEVDKAQNAVRVREICETYECGAITSPTYLMSQVQGGIIMGLGPALREMSQFANGKITNASFFRYQVPRFNDLPKLEINLLNRPDLASAGAGETPLIAVAPAIANAVFHATKQRIRQMPIHPVVA